ncbi:MAG: glycosyltransferase [Candidatus Taylorbacteria bacterium]|nr:glycosyltransferase [Candidatus Taylorbacteria bacterium]
MKEYIVVMPAYNEEKLIAESLSGVLAAAESCRSDFFLRKIIVCVNGCTDNTEEALGRVASAKPDLFSIIRSPKGYVAAMHALMETAAKDFPECFVIKIDADSRSQPDSFGILLAGLSRNPRIIVAGGYPYPNRKRGSRMQSLFTDIFWCRSFHPMSEVAVRDVSRFHPADEMGQDKGSGLKPEWRIRSKIYFHGRFFALRAGSYWHLESCCIADDIFFAPYILTRFGPGSIRMYYDARCLYDPYVTFKHHWKVYRRIKEDIDQLKGVPEYAWYLSDAALELDWKYIRTLRASVIVHFALYAVISSIEKISFRYVSYHPSHWEYDHKAAKVRA